MDVTGRPRPTSLRQALIRHHLRPAAAQLLPRIATPQAHRRRTATNMLLHRGLVLRQPLHQPLDNVWVLCGDIMVLAWVCPTDVKEAELGGTVAHGMGAGGWWLLAAGEHVAGVFCTYVTAQVNSDHVRMRARA